MRSFIYAALLIALTGCGRGLDPCPSALAKEVVAERCGGKIFRSEGRLMANSGEFMHASGREVAPEIEGCQVLTDGVYIPAQSGRTIETDCAFAVERDEPTPEFKASADNCSFVTGGC